ncbi:unnamed protein product, partial [Ectocarpus sp. 12 AP-2014]
EERLFCVDDSSARLHGYGGLYSSRTSDSCDSRRSFKALISKVGMVPLLCAHPACKRPGAPCRSPCPSPPACMLALSTPSLFPAGSHSAVCVCYDHEGTQ